MRLPTLLLAAAALWSVSFEGRAQVCSSINNEVVSVDVRNDEMDGREDQSQSGGPDHCSGQRPGENRAHAAREVGPEGRRTAPADWT